MSLIPSRPRNAVVSRDGPVYGRRPACFDTGASRPAQHEVRWGNDASESMRSVGTDAVIEIRIGTT